LEYLALIFIPAQSHAAENRSSTCWSEDCWEDPSNIKSSAKSKRLILHLPTVTSPSTRLWLSIHVL